MGVVNKLTEGRFALSLGEQVVLINPAQRSIVFNKVGNNEYEMVFKVNFKTKKDFVPGNPEINKFGPSDGSLAVLTKGAADPVHIEIPQFKFYCTAGGEVRMEVEAKVPGGDKGNHGS